MNETVEKIKKDQASSKLKNENFEEQFDTKRELSKKYQIQLESILSLVAKSKKKYQNEIYKLKLEIDNLNVSIDKQLQNSSLQDKSIISELELIISKEKELNNQYKNEIDIKENEMQNIKIDVQKLKEIYEKQDRAS